GGERSTGCDRCIPISEGWRRSHSWTSQRVPGTSWLLASGPASMKRSIKKGILSSIRRFGWEVRRSRNSNAEPPPTFDDPWEVIWHLRSGKPATLNCPIAECVRPFGHAFGSWEHLTEASREIIRDQSATYED